MDTQQAVSHIEKMAVADRLTYSAILASLLREIAATSGDASAFLAKVQAGALANLAAMKFDPIERPEESEVRKAAEGQIKSLTAFASRPAGGQER